jgi:hypothetical protein
MEVMPKHLARLDVQLCSIRDGIVRNVRRSLWLRVREGKTREDSGESDNWAEFEKHVDGV